MPTLLRLLLLCLIASNACADAGAPWARLTLGMAADEAVALLGEPILASKGRGFERWTYEDGAEVLLHGAVVGWTAPASAGLHVRSRDLWRDRPAGRNYATLHAPLRTPVRRAPVAAAPTVRPKPAPSHSGVGFEEYIQG